MSTLARLSDMMIPPLYRVAEGHGSVRSFAVRDRVQKCLGMLSRATARDARRAFDRATASDSSLGEVELTTLLSQYRQVHTRADRRSPADKAQARLKELIGRTNIARGQRALDIGCGEGSVTAALAWRGVRTQGIDLVDQTTPLARKSPAQFTQTDAHNTGLPGASFDLVYSFDTLEHVDDPTKVFDEAFRLLAPGGRFYASFGPLYHSPHGAHQWMSVDVPYAHLLFDAELLDATAARVGQRPMVKELNCWSLAKWRSLVAHMGTKLKLEVAIEKYNTAHTQLVSLFPAQFKRRVTHFDELIVRSIEVMGTKPV